MNNIKFSQFLTEKYFNAFTSEEKKKYADQVWDILVQSYKPIGGLRGIDSKQDMIDNVAMWKVAKRDNKVLAAILYKDKVGRKLVAVGTDGSAEGKQMLHNTLKKEFERSYMEISGPFFGFLKKNFPDLVKQYTIPPEEATKILGKELTPTKNNFYRREIRGISLEKIMVGTPGKTITS